MTRKNRLCKIILFTVLFSLLLSACAFTAAESTNPCEGGVHRGPFTYVLIKSATCTEDGSQDKYCSACGQKIGNEPIIHIGHQYEEVLNTVTPATCTTSGLRQKKSICRVCGYQQSVTDETIPPLGHDYGDWFVTKAPTCTEKGEQTRICSRDASHKETRDVAATGHKWGDWAVTTKPTCTEKGVETRVCANDPSHKETRDVPAIGHDYDSGKVTKAPNCAKPGVKTFTCKNDPSHTKTEEIPIEPNAHDWDGGKITKAPTCTSTGIKTFTCKNDPSHTRTETLPIEPDAHKWGPEKVIVEPTFEKPGKKIVTCENNPDHTKEVTIPSKTLEATICAFGPRLRDSSSILYPNTTEQWYMYTPFSVAEIASQPNGKMEYELVGSNAHIVGKAVITIKDGQLTFDYSLFGNTVKINYEFFTILNQITELDRYEPEDLRSLNMAANRRQPIDLNEYFGEDDQLVLYFCSRATYSYNKLIKSLDYNSLPHQQLLDKMWALID